MSSKSFKIEAILICFLSIILWVPPGSVTIQCSRESSSIVRKIVQSKLIPIFQKYHVDMTWECPFHPNRDLFWPQENAKINHRPNQYSCGFCGKHFLHEKYLDLHFNNRHHEHINQAEDAVCFADYCEILRCDVLVQKDQSLSLGQPVSTDIELYNEATALAAARREVIKSKLKNKSFNLPPALKEKLDSILAATGHKVEAPEVAKEKIHKRRKTQCSDKLRKVSADSHKNDSSKKSENSSDDDKDDNATTCEHSANDRKHKKASELQKNCKSEEIYKLKSKCERLIRICLASALIKLSVEEFKSLEDEMNKAVCWFLTCDRYWEDSSAQRPFPWALVFIMIVVLSLGICLCYYIIWVLFDTDETETLSSPSYNLLTAHSNIHSNQIPTIQLQTTSISSSTSSHGNANNLYPTGGSQQLQQMGYSEEMYAPTGIDEQYIFVTYPTDIKKRLTERYDKDTLISFSNSSQNQ